MLLRLSRLLDEKSVSLHPRQVTGNFSRNIRIVPDVSQREKRFPVKSSNSIPLISKLNLYLNYPLENERVNRNSIRLIAAKLNIQFMRSEGSYTIHEYSFISLF